MIKKINDAIEARRLAVQDDENEKGFTLIELMVVIIIIGILAAIAIPAFLNQRANAWDATAKSDLANFEIAAASYSVAHNGSYSGLTFATLYTGSATTSTFQPSSDDTTSSQWTVVPSSDGNSYTVSVYDKNFAGSTAGHIWKFDSSTGATTVS